MFSDFDTQLLVDTLNIDEKTATKLKSPNGQRDQIGDGTLGKERKSRNPIQASRKERSKKAIQVKNNQGVNLNKRDKKAIQVEGNQDVNLDKKGKKVIQVKNNQDVNLDKRDKKAIQVEGNQDKRGEKDIHVQGNQDVNLDQMDEEEEEGPGCPTPRPPTRCEQKCASQGEQGNDNGLEETICTMKLRKNIASPSFADL
ncbi:hypothetical protein L6164_009983 [Bauhinia variegata]|uniref:Uncharacterized protein n=1 Tax=Bauhinia variegata TaxID=167791 RepID=A0ACB9PLP7_BAUVA|nr:hypothetical protein L6164_009983 [Bauhinia variegata]